MLLFIIIFFAMVIVVGTAMIFGLSVFLKSRRKSLGTNNSKQFDDAPPYRSLFEPDEAEIRAIEAEKTVESRAKEFEEARCLSAEKIEKVEDYRKIWHVSPDKTKTIELLRLASESENADTFSETAENVMEIWRENRNENLTADNLADLLDSHLKTLPQQERTAGALFWLKQEIAELRRKSEENF